VSELRQKPAQQQHTTATAAIGKAAPKEQSKVEVKQETAARNEPKLQAAGCESKKL